MIGNAKLYREGGLQVNRFFRLDFFRVFAAFMALISLGCVTGLFVFLVTQSVPLLVEQKLNFLLGQDWWAGEVYGALPMVYGSCMVMGLALILALPLAVGGAVFTS